MTLIKRLLIYVIVGVVVFFVSYYLHSYLIASSKETLPFNLKSVYLFHCIASVAMVLFFELLASLTTQFKDQLGFLYLGTMALKMMFFCVFFKDVLFSDIALSKTDSLSMLIPLFIFLFYEVIFIVKVLNKST